MEDIVAIKRGKRGNPSKKTTKPVGATGPRGTRTNPVMKPAKTKEQQQQLRDRVNKLAATELKTGTKEFADRMKKYKRLAPRADANQDKKKGELARWERARNARERREERRAEAAEEASVFQSAAAEILLPESAGYIEAEEGERTDTITQQELAEAVDIRSARKAFSLDLPTFGPYSIDYTRTGKHLLMAGRKGHVAVVEWQTKKLVTEFNVNQTVHDCTFLHNEGLFALAQKRWVHIYDGSGTELHCLRNYRLPLALEFLPYHFLLASSSESGKLRYIDVSTGTHIVEHTTHMGPCDVMCQNPWNAVICLGHTKGCVTMWSPNMAKPLAKMICHRGPVKGIAVDNAGYYLATSGLDNTVKIWDVRTFKPIASYATRSAATSLAISQRGLLAVAGGPHVQVWRREVMTKGVASPYVAHLLPGAAVREVRFCPYEDFLGVGHSGGFTSMVVPGAGEPNYDALEANPFESKKQRRETEVARLLEKIPATMISLNPGSVGGIASLEERRAQETQDEANARPADTEDGEINPYDEEFEGMGIDAEQNEKRKARKEALRAKHKREGRHRKSKIIIIQEKEGDAQSKKRKDGKKVVDHVSDALDLFSKKVKI